MIKTSIQFPETLHQRLLWHSKKESKPIYLIVIELVEAGLTAREQADLDRMYGCLDQLDGIGEAGGGNASTTINQTLYGKITTESNSTA